jgi:hypothetical protein
LSGDDRADALRFFPVAPVVIDEPRIYHGFIRHSAYVTSSRQQKIELLSTLVAGSRRGNAAVFTRGRDTATRVARELSRYGDTLLLEQPSDAPLALSQVAASQFRFLVSWAGYAKLLPERSVSLVVNFDYPDFDPELGMRASYVAERGEMISFVSSLRTGSLERVCERVGIPVSWPQEQGL